jgi:hypothetical protein
VSTRRCPAPGDRRAAAVDRVGGEGGDQQQPDAPPGEQHHLSATGATHAVAGQLAFVSMGAAVALLTPRLRGKRTHGALCGAAALSLLGLAFSVVVTALGLFTLFGLAERVVLPPDLVWLVLAARAGGPGDD